MERFEKDCGALIMCEGRLYDYEGGYTDQGKVFKDWDAFKSGEGICYISEHELEQLHEDLAELDAIYENTRPGEEGYLTDEDYRVDREFILKACGETRDTIIQQVLEGYEHDYMLTMEQAVYFAEDVLSTADWACIATYLSEGFQIEDSIEFDEIKGGGIFTELQREAVRKGMTPLEYAESQGIRPLEQQ